MQYTTNAAERSLSATVPTREGRVFYIGLALTVSSFSLSMLIVFIGSL